jgi:serine/threonine-protein kinase RsbW
MPRRTFPARLEKLSEIGEFIVQAAQKAGLDDAGVYAVQLAVDEAATNIIEHGYGGDDRGDIVIGYQILANGIRVTLQDKGIAFDPDLIPEPSFEGKTIADLTPRGLGIFFMRKMMDEVKFDFSPHVGNKLIMVKYR